MLGAHEQPPQQAAGYQPANPNLLRGEPRGIEPEEIEVSRAKAGYRQRFGNAGLRRPISLLAHLLVNFRENANQRNASAPLLVYRPIVQSERSGDNNEFAVRSRD